MKNIKRNRRRGFTLIEILVVIAMIAILAAIVIIAINPAKQFAQARNSQRQANINTILNAVGQRMADNKGIFDGTFEIGGVTYACPAIGTATSSITYNGGGGSTTAGDLSCLVPTYIASMPFDPSAQSTTNTGYEVSADATGRIMVCAPNAATEAAIPGNSALCVKR